MALLLDLHIVLQLYHCLKFTNKYWSNHYIWSNSLYFFPSSLQSYIWIGGSSYCTLVLSRYSGVLTKKIMKWTIPTIIKKKRKKKGKTQYSYTTWHNVDQDSAKTNKWCFSFPLHWVPLVSLNMAARNGHCFQWVTIAALYLEFCFRSVAPVL